MSSGLVLALEPAVSAAEVRALLAHASWARKRSESGIRLMLQNSLCVVTVRREGRLVGFGRAWGDGVYRATIDDLVVLPEERKGHLGTRMMENLLAELSDVEEVSLSTAVETVPFYERFGFKPHAGAHLKRSAVTATRKPRRD